MKANPVPLALFASSFCKSQTGRSLVVFLATNAAVSMIHLSNVAVALKPMIENTTIPANMDVQQFVMDTKINFKITKKKFIILLG